MPAKKKDGALAPEGIAALVANASLRIIADHARAATFLINDGVIPANEGRGYVLRKILRRGIRHGRLLGQEQPFLYDMVYAVRDLMQGAYPELHDSAARVAKVVEAEEKQFDRVLEVGSRQLDEVIRESASPTTAAYYAQHGYSFQKSEDERLADALKVFVEQANPDLNSVEDFEIRAIIEKDKVPGKLGPVLVDVIVKDLRKNPLSVLPGDKAFHLYETFGLSAGLHGRRGARRRNRIRPGRFRTR